MKEINMYKRIFFVALLTLIGINEGVWADCICSCMGVKGTKIHIGKVSTIDVCENQCKEAFAANYIGFVCRPVKSETE